MPVPAFVDAHKSENYGQFSSAKISGKSKQPQNSMPMAEIEQMKH
jgi:hypothetical protein